MFTIKKKNIKKAPHKENEGMTAEVTAFGAHRRGCDKRYAYHNFREALDSGCLLPKDLRYEAQLLYTQKLL
jgi:hypothetical protein